MHVVVIGGGAAGFFASIRAAERMPHGRVTLLEKSDKLLAKVRISGGGRCNVTHDLSAPGALARRYPRGGRFLKKAFSHFGQPATVEWFRKRGAELKVEPDGRMFPTSDSSSSIIECLTETAEGAGVEVRKSCGVSRIHLRGGAIHLELSNGQSMVADRVIVAAGGQPKREGFAWLESLGHSIVPPLPSLFTFNMPDEPIRELMGLSVEHARVRVAGSGLEHEGPLLITHWGMSGPAILGLSAWGAREIAALQYQFTLLVNWTGSLHEAQVREVLFEAKDADRRTAANAVQFGIPKRLWGHLLHKAHIAPERVWCELPHKDRNRMVELLTNDKYAVRGKTTFKEEFVTAGGIALEEVSPSTMESRIVPGLFFAGEVLDIDGITGGFNFQAAWTTGYLAGTAASMHETQHGAS